MNRISKLVIILASASLIAACGTTSDPEQVEPSNPQTCPSGVGTWQDSTSECPIVDPISLPGRHTDPIVGGGSGSGDHGSTRQGNGDKGTELVTVPNLVGTKTDPATRWLEGTGLRAVVTPRYVTRPGDAGAVVGQDKAAGAQVARGTVVGLEATVFDATKLRTVPDLVGKSDQDVRSTLQAIGLVPSISYVKTTNQATAGARSSDPAKNTRVLVGSTVRVEIAVWEPTVRISLVYVPGIVGLTDSAARGAVEAGGLVFNVRQHVTNDVHVQTGVCTAQSLSAGSRVPRGTTLDCDVWVRF